MAMGMILAYVVSALHDVVVVVAVVVVVVVDVVVVAAYLAVSGGHSQRGHGHDPGLWSLLGIWPLLQCCPHRHPLPPPRHWHRQHLCHHPGDYNQHHICIICH